MLTAYSERHVYDPLPSSRYILGELLTNSSEHVIIPRTENTIKCKRSLRPYKGKCFELIGPYRHQFRAG